MSAASDSIKITIGAGRKRPQGRRLSEPVNGGGPVAATRNAIGRAGSSEEAWWSPILWSGDYRDGDKFEQSIGPPGDIDYYDEGEGNPEGGDHVAPPPEMRAALDALVRAGEFPGNLYHPSTRGIRLQPVLDTPITTPTMHEMAGRAFLASMQEALARHGLMARPPDPSKKEKHPRGGFWVDEGVSTDCARLLFGPSARVDGIQRNAEIVIIREAPYTLAELLEMAPPDVAPPPAPAAPRPVTPATPSSDLDEADRRWNSDHRTTLPRSGGAPCPICKCKCSCWGALPKTNGEKWWCWNSDHSGVGHESKRGWFGDFLDLEAHARGISRVEVLRADGYLPPICGEATPRGKACASTELYSDGRCRIHSTTEEARAARREYVQGRGAALTLLRTVPDIADAEGAGGEPPEWMDEVPPLGEDIAPVDFEQPLRKSYLSALRIVSENRCDVLGGRRLEFNEMIGAPMLGRALLRDVDIYTIRGEIERRIVYALDKQKRPIGLALSMEDIQAAIVQVAHESPFHPVREYLRGLKWDGCERVNRVVAQVLRAEGTPQHVAMVRKWFVSAVARALKPGCKVDTVLILVGEQGAGKSTFFRILADPWFGDSAIDIHNKDAYATLRRSWVTEWAELEALRRARDADAVKSFLTSPIDIYRPPYGRLDVEVPRSGVIVGTTNAREFLADETGARRFWPMAVGHIDVALLQAWRDQLWAEAVALFDAAARWWMTADEDLELAGTRQAFAVVDPWHHEVVDFVATRSEPPTTEDIYRQCLKMEIEKWGRAEEMRIGKILGGAGYHKARPHRLRPRVWVKVGS